MEFSLIFLSLNKSNNNNLWNVDIFMLTNTLITTDLFEKSLLEYREITNKKLNFFMKGLKERTFFKWILADDTAKIWTKRNFNSMNISSLKYMAWKLEDDKIQKFSDFQFSKEYKYYIDTIWISEISLYQAFISDFPFIKYEKSSIIKEPWVFDTVLILFIRMKENLNNFSSI